VKRLTNHVLFCLLACHLAVPLAVAERLPMRVGILVPLTGPAAEYGVAIKNGFELARSKSIDKDGNCNFSFDDSLYDSKQAVISFRRMAAERYSLVYTFGGPMGEVLAPIAEKEELPLITDSIDPAVSVNRKFVSRYANSYNELGSILAEALKKRGVKKAAIVYVENAYINAVIKGLNAGAVERGIEINIIGSVTGDQADLRTLLPKVAHAQFDAFGNFLFPGQISNFSRIMKPYLNGKLIFGGDFLESPVEIEAAQGVLDGAIYPNNLVSPDFREEYMIRFKSAAQIKFAAEGFDVGNLILDRICKSRKRLSAEEVLDRIYAPEARVGAQGKTEFIRTSEGDKYFRAPVEIMQASTAMKKGL
jgi:branched-chain amino acid transport system substrate-binding protein